MKLREKTFILAIGIIFLALGLVACGPAQDPDDEAATATAQAEGDPEEAQEAHQRCQRAKVLTSTLG